MEEEIAQAKTPQLPRSQNAAVRDRSGMKGKSRVCSSLRRAVPREAPHTQALRAHQRLHQSLQLQKAPGDSHARQWGGALAQSASWSSHWLHQSSPAMPSGSRAPLPPSVAQVSYFP